MKDAQETGESYWPLPLYEPYTKQLNSSIANLKNVGGVWGGAITAALFLKQFVGNTPWRHLDIAGPAFKDNAGATGFGVRSILEVLKSYIKSPSS
jgi:leucyl aminopeptidase